MNAQVAGRLVFNAGDLIVAATLAGFGLAWLAGDIVAEHVSTGRLTLVLDEWAAIYPGYHLYYATRHASPTLVLVVNALRLREDL